MAAEVAPTSAGREDPWRSDRLLDESVLRAAAVANSPDATRAFGNYLTKDGLLAVGALASARTKVPLGSDGTSASTNFRSLAGGTDALFDQLRRRVLLNDPPTSDVPPFSDCLADLLKSTNTLELQGSTTVRPYNAELLNVCSATHSPVDLEDLLDPETRQMARYPADFITLAEDDVDFGNADFLVYSDPALRDKKELLGLITVLARRGLICYRRSRSGWVGVFTVDKKGTQLRLVFDCRGSNRLCRAPPKSFLSAPGALAGLRLSDHALSTEGRLQPDRPPRLLVVAVDLVDSFYLFRWARLAELFAFEHAYSAEALGIDHLVDADGRREDLAPHDMVFPCLATLPMGWTWSLHFCQCVCARAMVDAAVRMGLSPSAAKQQLLLEGRPAPRVGPGKPILAPYVDNCNAVVWDSSDAKSFCGHLTAVLNEWGLAHRIETEGSPRWDTLGTVLDVERRILLNKPTRLWRLRAALLFLAQQGSASGDVVRVVLGHVVHACMVFRPALALVQNLYRFAVGNGPCVASFDDFEKRELVCAAYALPLLGTNLAVPLADTALCSDSSAKGYAVHETHVSADEAYRITAVRERWRFRPARPGPPRRLATQDARHVSELSAFDAWAQGNVSAADRQRADTRAAESRLPAAVQHLDAMDPAEAVSIRELDAADEDPDLDRDCLFGASSVPPLPDQFVQRSRWKRLVVGAWRAPDAIHSLEARASLDGFTLAASRAELARTEIVSAGDNMAELLATESGRARDRGLNCVCRRAAGWQLATETLWRRRYVETKRNPSDADSRLADDGVLVAGQRFYGRRLDEHLASRKRLPQRQAPTAPNGTAILELFAGCSRFTAACADAGLRVAAPVDIAHGPHHDVLKPGTQRAILGWVRGGLLWAMWIAIPCTADSIATAGQPTDQRKQQQRGRLLSFIIRLIKECYQHGVSIIVENPLSSRLWRNRGVARALAAAGCVDFDYDTCGFGTAYRKPQRLRSNLPLHPVRRRCACTLPHEILSGKAKLPSGQWCWKTTLAGRYPFQLCDTLGRVFADAAPRSGWRRVGEPTIHPYWLRSVGAKQLAQQATPLPSRPAVCPSTEWEDAVAFAIGDGSRERRLAAIAARSLDAADYRVDSRPAAEGPDTGAASAALRMAPILRGEEPASGVLRRHRVKPATRAIYSQLVSSFHSRFGIHDGSDPKAIDTALDTHLDELYLKGEPAGPGRMIYYALMWHHSLTHAQLPLARAARISHARICKPKLSSPATWEGVLLMAGALLFSRLADVTLSEAACAASGFLLSFDVYGRATDLCRALRREMRPPIQNQRGVPALWTITLFPSESLPESKTRTQDDTAAIGSSNPRRRWLSRICAPLVAHAPSDERLLGMTPQRYNQLFRLAASLAGMQGTTAHRLRHGGASADALLRGTEALSDMEIAARGRWQSLSSVRRYRQPAQYLKELQKLTPKQLEEASRLESSLPTALVAVLRKRRCKTDPK